MPNTFRAIVKIKWQSDVAETSFTDNAIFIVYGAVFKARFRSTQVCLKKMPRKMISGQIFAMPADPPARQLPADELDQYAGSYLASSKQSVRIERTKDGLVSAVGGAKSDPLRVVVGDVSFTPGRPHVKRI